MIELVTSSYAVKFRPLDHNQGIPTSTLQSIEQWVSTMRYWTLTYVEDGWFQVGTFTVSDSPYKIDVSILPTIETTLKSLCTGIELETEVSQYNANALGVDVI